MRDNVLAAIDEALLEAIRQRFISRALDINSPSDLTEHVAGFVRGLHGLKQFYALVRERAGITFTDEG